ncbi:hypothetical protein [Actinoplanes sp. N902-109]|uniref:hypothetical protein n=1 Tax=Actinoplanes sp. (strain N902-109) TaxID=649831 RepID=UPI0003294158|nr:hypothetical protein [Actinoplanes sp. N902-109]AGL18940.1 hypothetical protein L083_5430 [Actinoplanes sp. N902-109]
MTDIIDAVAEVAAATDVEEIEARWSTEIQAPDNRGLVIGTVTGGLTVQVDRLRRMERLEPDYVRATLASYVERPFLAYGRQANDTSTVAQRLLDRHCVVLLGESGSGRRTAAIAVLGRLSEPLEKVPDWEPGQPDWRAADLPATPGTGYLFTLPDDGLVTAELGRQLRAYRERLAAEGGHLVVVATPSAWDATGEIWPDLTYVVGMPERRALLTAQVHALWPEAAVPEDPRITELIARAGVRDIARLANLMVQTLRSAPVDAGDRDVVSDVIGAYQEWTAQLDAWFKQNRNPEERLFLLAAAVLASSPASRVLRCAEDLGTLLGTGQFQRHSITTAGVRELTASIGAHLVEPGARLAFDRPAYAVAVLDYFLADRSDSFRVLVRTWLAQAPRVRQQAEAVEIAELVAEAVLGLAQRRRDIEFVPAVVNHWVSSRPLRPTLIRLLTAVALTPEAGSVMRARLNTWATDSQSPDVWRLVADVCTGDLADAYPRVALTRIKNLAVRAAGDLVPVAVDAVLRLWSRPAMRHDILDRLVSWLADPAAPSFAVATRVVAALGEEFVQGAFAGRLDRTSALSHAIGNLVEHRDEPEQLQDTLFDWLDRAVTNEEYAAWLIEVLAASVAGPGSALRITCIRTFAHGWERQHTSASRAALRERLVRRVSDADATIRGWVRTIERVEVTDARMV